ncbi:MAG TPA: helix-turn-helix domain-containing protein [Candidatus Paceibacterota bacterium]
MFEKYLQGIGLSEKEASVYVALLQVDAASVIDLSKKTDVNRSTVYVVLDGLMKKGLVSETQVGKKTHYQAEPPERLETFVERQRAALEEQQKRLKEIIPQLKSVQREVGERPIVKYFEGRDGIISSEEELFESQDRGGITHLVYPKDLLEEIFSPDEKEKYRRIRIGKDIHSKVLYTSGKTVVSEDGTGDRVKVNGEKYPITCDIAIYKDRVRINTLGKSLAAIFIKSQDVADTLNSIIDLAFDSLKKEEK